ncbi:MAG TPA: hypothetical protein VG734_08145 [Lacunisphaera sp.]|nr:hypothetical protein [Lacunisphaera sp.]
MKTFTASRLLIAALVAAGTARAADEAVISPTKRQEVLALAKSLLTTAAPVTMAKDPFHSEAYAETLAGATTTPGTTQTSPTPEVTPAGPRNPRELLQAIATSPSLKPTAVFALRDGPMLVFGQKRVKAGGTLTITFEGTEYTLEIVSIAPPNFTLRLNREEFTRPIK